jgi:anti-anti-sigma regulatory factor
VLIDASRRHASSIVVDLDGVSFIDACAISALVTARNNAQATGSTFTVTNLRPDVRRVLEVTEMLTPLTRDRCAADAGQPGAAPATTHKPEDARRTGVSWPRDDHLRG